MMQNKFIFGITGPTGAGKTTVSKVFENLGVYVIDADKVARIVMEPGHKCLDEVRAAFGTEVIRNDGTLDRKRLGDIVFSDAAKLKKLNSISHKHISREISHMIFIAKADMIAIDGAVLIGSGIDKQCRCIVSVIASPETRMSRICARDGISTEDAKKRINSQKNNKFYIENSDYIIYNDKNSSLSDRIKEVWVQLKRRKEESI